MSGFKQYIVFILLFIPYLLLGQVPVEYTAEYLKSASFMEQSQSTKPFFQLSTGFLFEFDDLYADEHNYFYRVKAYNYDWTPSALREIEYINGMDNQRIQQMNNSFNTLQEYTHYSLRIPNAQYVITKSGNYALEIYDEDGEIVIRRKFVLIESQVDANIIIKRTRDLENYDEKQRLELSIRLGEGEYQNPTQHIKVSLFQNGEWATIINNIKPQYIIANELSYKYDKETTYWGGNQFLNFDNSDIRQLNNMIGNVTRVDGMYNTYLYTNESRRYKGYSYFPDLNGAFYPRNINNRAPSTEAEYSWVYFSYQPTSDMPSNTDYYVVGSFNNYELTQNNKLDYNEGKNQYEKAILIKQGFTNFKYVAVINNNINAEWNPDGNYAQTTNTYQIVVYYRSAIDLYDRAIALGMADARNMTN